jgi:undecaprenyl-diphosphatase
MIQLGSILAVVWLYRAKIMTVAAGLPSKPEARRFVLMIALATLPFLVAGALFGKYVRGVLYGNFVVIAAAFIIGGVIMLVVERVRPAPDVLTVDELPTGRAFAIGAFQALALIPGVSRSGGTIVAGMAMRVDRAAAAEFTFFLAMPAMTAAFAKDLLDLRGHLGSARGLEIAVGFVMAFLASAVVVRPFLKFVRRSGFAPFAWYRIAAGAALLAALAGGWI